MTSARTYLFVVDVLVAVAKLAVMRGHAPHQSRSRRLRHFRRRIDVDLEMNRVRHVSRMCHVSRVRRVRTRFSRRRCCSKRLLRTVLALTGDVGGGGVSGFPGHITQLPVNTEVTTFCVRA